MIPNPSFSKLSKVFGKKIQSSVGPKERGTETSKEDILEEARGTKLSTKRHEESN